LALVLPALLALLEPQTPGAAVDLVVLVKPQFEVGRAQVGKGGVVRDPVAHGDAIAGVIGAAAPLGLEPAGLIASPITGPAGNHEYLLWLRSLGADRAGPGAGDGTPDSAAIERLVTATLAGP
jgi:23S rRNA (cytidine1920-2'-O)/16S rRNA (cytidine1409-2'-O)-methyltransferase